MNEKWFSLVWTSHSRNFWFLNHGWTLWAYRRMIDVPILDNDEVFLYFYLFCRRRIQISKKKTFELVWPPMMKWLNQIFTKRGGLTPTLSAHIATLISWQLISWCLVKTDLIYHYYDISGILILSAGHTSYLAYFLH